MSENKNKMIDPADVRALLEACDSTDPRYSDFENLVSGLRNLLSRDYPEDMLCQWAEHPEYGRVLACSAKPDKNGLVKIVARVSVSSLRFEEQHPETLTTTEDYENAPVGTVVATTGGPPVFKRSDGIWRDNFGFMVDPSGANRTVLRWGCGQ